MVGAGGMNLRRSGWKRKRLPGAALQRLTLGTGLPGRLAWVFLLIQAGVQRVPMEPEAGGPVMGACRQGCCTLLCLPGKSAEDSARRSDLLWLMF